MNLTTQLRIVLLLVGAAILLGIYLLGKRSTSPRMPVDLDDNDEPPARDSAAEFAPADELDDEELDAPAYMRRQGQREARQDYEPRIANVHDYDGSEAVHDGSQYFVDIAVHNPRHEVAPGSADAQVSIANPVRASQYDEPAGHTGQARAETAVSPFEGRHEPRVSLDESFEMSAALDPHLSATSLHDFNVLESMHVADSVRTVALPEPEVSAPAIPVMAEPVATSLQMPMKSHEQPDAPAAAPMLSDVVRKPAQLESPASTATTTKASGSVTARRKIIALRLPMPERVPGSELLSLLRREQLQHGKFSIFHRLHESNSVFSVASMVEPGTFEPQVMAEQQFPGVTLFMLLPGPLDGLVAFDQMMSCAQRLAHATGGVLQDERGSKLTAQSMDRLRDEVLDFQHLIGGVVTAH